MDWNTLVIDESPDWNGEFDKCDEKFNDSKVRQKKIF